MAQLTTPATDCRYCGSAIPDDRLEAELKYCTEACYLRSKGERLLDNVKNDHRTCSTCYRQLAEVEYVDRFTSKIPRLKGSTRAPPSNYIGHKYATPHVVRAIDEFDRVGASPIEGTRWGCECGTVDHHDTHGFIQRDVEDADAVRDRLFARLVELYQRGTIDKRPRRERFEAGWDDGDAALAAGMACYG